MDFKVRCTSDIKSDVFVKDHCYKIINSAINDDENRVVADGFNNVDDLNQYFNAKFELTTDRPRICEVLGVEVNQDFMMVGGISQPYHVDKSGMIVDCDGDFYGEALCNAISGKTKIFEQPQFCEDEKALMRLYVGAGYPWFVRTGRWFYICKNKPSVINGSGISTNGEHQYGVPELLTQINEHEPFNAAEYLEGLK